MSDNDSAEYKTVGSVDDFTVGKARRIDFGGRFVAVWRLEDGFFAIEDSCPHAAASLASGLLEEDYVVACPRHGSQFDLRSGRLISLPAVRGVRSYAVKVEDGVVMVCTAPVSDAEPELLRFD